MGRALAARRGTESDKRLTGVFTHASKRYGYSKVTARFTDMEGTKVKWKRNGGSIRLEVSRSYEAADDRTLADLADAVFYDIATKEGDKRSEVLIVG